MKKNIFIIISLTVLAILAGVLLQKRHNNLLKEEVKGEITSTLANVEEVSVSIQESFPLSARAVMTGNYSDGCSSAGTKDVYFDKDSNTFQIEFFVDKPKDSICTQAIVPFSESVGLDIYGFSKGNYTVIANGVETSFILDIDNILEDTTGKS